MPHRILLLVLLLTVAFTSISAKANATEQWLTDRRTSTEELLSVVESSDNESEVLRARLILADRAINQSTARFAEHLAAAEELVVPGSDAYSLATALRCQLDHRQGKPSAAQSCGLLAEQDSQTEDSFLNAYRQVTLAFYFYREGQHARSLEEAEKALILAEAVEDHGLIAAANNIIGLHFATRLRPRMSVTHFEIALEHARQMVAPEFRYLVQLNLASSYTYLGRAEDSLELLLEARATPIINLYPTRRLVAASMIAQASVAAGHTDGTEAELQDTIRSVSDLVLPDGMTFGHT